MSSDFFGTKIKFSCSHSDQRYMNSLLHRFARKFPNVIPYWLFVQLIVPHSHSTTLAQKHIHSHRIVHVTCSLANVSLTPNQSRTTSGWVKVLWLETPQTLQNSWILQEYLVLLSPESRDRSPSEAKGTLRSILVYKAVRCLLSWSGILPAYRSFLEWWCWSVTAPNLNLRLERVQVLRRIVNIYALNAITSLIWMLTQYRELLLWQMRSIL